MAKCKDCYADLQHAKASRCSSCSSYQDRFRRFCFGNWPWIVLILTVVNTWAAIVTISQVPHISDQATHAASDVQSMKSDSSKVEKMLRHDKIQAISDSVDPVQSKQTSRLLYELNSPGTRETLENGAKAAGFSSFQHFLSAPLPAEGFEKFKASIRESDLELRDQDTSQSP